MRFDPFCPARYLCIIGEFCRIGNPNANSAVVGNYMTHSAVSGVEQQRRSRGMLRLVSLPFGSPV